MVQLAKGLRLYPAEPDGGGNDVFVHISAVERAGISHLNEGQKISFEIEAGRDGKSSAVNLKEL